MDSVTRLNWAAVALRPSSAARFQTISLRKFLTPKIQSRMSRAHLPLRQSQCTYDEPLSERRSLISTRRSCNIVRNEAVPAPQVSRQACSSRIEGSLTIDWSPTLTGCKIGAGVERRIDIDQGDTTGVLVQQAGQRELVVAPDQHVSIRGPRAAGAEQCARIPLARRPRLVDCLDCLKGQPDSLDSLRRAIPLQADGDAVQAVVSADDCRSNRSGRARSRAWLSILSREEASRVGRSGRATRSVRLDATPRPSIWPKVDPALVRSAMDPGATNLPVVGGRADSCAPDLLGSSMGAKPSKAGGRCSLQAPAARRLVTIAEELDDVEAAVCEQLDRSWGLRLPATQRRRIDDVSDRDAGQRRDGGQLQDIPDCLLELVFPAELGLDVDVSEAPRAREHVGAAQASAPRAGLLRCCKALAGEGGAQLRHLKRGEALGKRVKHHLIDLGGRSEQLHSDRPVCCVDIDGQQVSDHLDDVVGFALVVAGQLDACSAGIRVVIDDDEGHLTGAAAG